jgi:AcrR family transcriptional regulator
MREVDEANTEAKRRLVIDAAVRCLARNGVAKTSIADICKEAGMRSGHLYYYFENKDALLAAVMLRNHDETVETIEHMFDGGNLISQIVDVHVQAEAGRLAYGLTPAVRIELECYFSRLPEGEQSRARSSDRLLDAMRGSARNAVAAGRLPKDLDVEGFVSAVALIWQGLSFSRLAPDFDIEEMRRTVHLLMEPWLSVSG